MISEKFVINPTNEFHILRHFESVDNSYKETLQDKQYWYHDYEQKNSFPRVFLKKKLNMPQKPLEQNFIIISLRSTTQEIFLN